MLVLPGSVRYCLLVGRTFLLGAVAIVLLAGALGVIVWRNTMPGPPPAAAPPTPSPPATERAPPPAPAPPGPPMPAGPEQPPGARSVGRQGRTPGDLFTALGPLGTSVGQCVARTTAVKGSPRQAVLVLDLQPLAGAMRIVDASPLQPGDESAALGRCARSEMVGREIPLASARPGRAYKMSYSVQY